MLHTKFGDHQSNISVGDDVQMFSIFSFSGPFKGPIKLILTNLIKDYLRMLQTKFGDHPSSTSVQRDI
jgi:hypothetical protein